MTSEEFTATGPSSVAMAKAALQSLDVDEKEVESIHINLEYAEAEQTEAEAEPTEATASIEESEEVQEVKEEDSEERSYELKPDVQKYDVMRAIIEHYDNEGLTSTELRDVIDEELHDNLSTLLREMAVDNHLLARKERKDREHRSAKWEYEPTEFGLGEFQNAKRQKTSEEAKDE